MTLNNIINSKVTKQLKYLDFGYIDQILIRIHKMLFCMTLLHGIYVKIFLFHFKQKKKCLILGEFECDQHGFVHLFRILFYFLFFLR